MASQSLQVKGRTDLPNFSLVLTGEALEFVEKIQRKFSGERKRLLELRKGRQAKFDQGVRPDFLQETENIRKSEWRTSPIPNDLVDRRVEITGPSGDTKMVINAFNSGANVYMADFEDAQSPTWENTIQGQINLGDAIDRKIAFKSPEGKEYKLNEKISTLIVRPRGWHLLEKHVEVDGEPVSASIFDFAIFLFHNARNLTAKGSGPYYYLPKLESHLEARLWNDVFDFAEDELGLPHGTIKVTVLIETIVAAFEMDEILYVLKDHIVGLNCGRWDYIFSFIKKFRDDPSLVLPREISGDDGQGFSRGLRRASDQNVPQEGRERDRRDVGIHPGEKRRQGKPARFRKCEEGQGEGGEGRARRDMGSSSGASHAREGSVRRWDEGTKPALQSAERCQCHSG